jgi:uncharacterized protein YqeY
MDIKEQLDIELKNAMRSKDPVARDTIRMIRTNIKLAEVDKKRPLDDAELIAILHKEVKKREETISDAQKAERPDLIEQSIAELAIIDQFLPEPLSEEELRQQAEAAISEVGASSPADMGKVMKILIPRLQGRVPGSQASKMVKDLLAQ